ncbi:hypothetical protein OZX65_06970 [Leuconostocaceae bacterium ESL0723]|nr:hypothetical protein OZX65_06970 [Leuconostocaceae bacterium ESL0723]
MKKYIIPAIILVIVAAAGLIWHFDQTDKHGQSNQSSSVKSSHKAQSSTSSSSTSTLAASSATSTQPDNSPSASSTQAQTPSSPALINTNDQAVSYIEQQLGYQNNSNISGGAEFKQDASGSYYIVQLRDLNSVLQNGAGGTIGYYQVYPNGDWHRLN